LQSLSFSRDVERTADLKGADTCAEANSNPWGLVKLIEAFGKSNAGGKLEMLSDHPRDDHRISDLEAHFRNHPERFTRFKRDSAWSTPLNISRR
jgi:predicted Zn-dependent protease